jgi:hydrogenase maturation protein HypF
VKKPKQTALGVLYEIFGSEAFDGNEPPLLRQMLEKGIRTPRTSSAGRLFDAVASITGIRHRVSFEGQAAMELEFAVRRNVDDSYPYVIRDGRPLIADWEPMIRRIVADVRESVDAGVIAARLHNTLAEIIFALARRAGQRRVALTGGCFQNRYLTERTVKGLTRLGFQAYFHQRVPPNDGGIALGQAVAARDGMNHVSGDSR